ncbi:MAG TPA: hypothetical protein VHG91_00125 [Longimicrobium sp.]|nr:hypothetical protein [Longimicrobium sp.]
MRPLFFAFALPFAAACATVPSQTAPADRALALGSPDESFSCAMREVNELGYTVADADRGAGFLRAERDRTSLGDALLGGVQRFDQLTLTVFPREDRRTVLRVVTDGYEVEARGENRGGRVSGVPSPRADEDARAILSACGEPEGAPSAAARVGG